MMMWSLGLEHEFLVVAGDAHPTGAALPPARVLNTHRLVRQARKELRVRAKQHAWSARLASMSASASSVPLPFPFPSRAHRRRLVRDGETSSSLSSSNPSPASASALMRRALLSSFGGDNAPWSTATSAAAGRVDNNNNNNRPVTTVRVNSVEKGGGDGDDGHNDNNNEDDEGEEGEGETAPETVDADAIESDVRFVEVKSTRHRMATIESVERQVRDAEQVVLEVARARHSAPDARIFPYSGFARLGPPRDPERALAEAADGEKKGPAYAGSYHLWVTLPHGADTWSDPSERGRLARTHALLAHLLQWIEPLLLCLMAGDPRAPGRGLEYPRASMRATLNPFCGYGTTDPKALLHLEWSQLSEERRRVLNSRVRYYPTVAHLRYAYGDDDVLLTSASSPSSPPPPYQTLTAVERVERKKRMVRKLAEDQSVALWVNMEDPPGSGRTRKRPLELCTNVARADWNIPGEEEGGNTFQEEVRLPNRDARLPYQDLLYAQGSYYDLGRGGNDVRIVGCGKSLAYPMRPGWNKAWVREEGATPTRTRRDPNTGRRFEEVQLVLHFFRVREEEEGHDDDDRSESADDDDGRRRNHRRVVDVRSATPSTDSSDSSDEEEEDKEEREGRSRRQRQKRREEEKKQREESSRAIGFEFRVLDNVPPAVLTEVLRLVALLAACAVREERRRVSTTPAAIALLERERALHDRAWNAALVAVSQRGSGAPLPPEYVRRLEQVVFGRPDQSNLKRHGHRENDSSSSDDDDDDDDTNASDDDDDVDASPTTAYGMLLQLCRDLFRRYGADPVTRLLHDGGNKKTDPLLRRQQRPPLPPDHNFLAWCRAFRAHGGKRRRHATNTDILAFLRERRAARDAAWEPDQCYVPALESRIQKK